MKHNVQRQWQWGEVVECNMKNIHPHKTKLCIIECQQNVKKIKQQKKLAWINFCTTLDYNSNESQIWKLFRRMEGKDTFAFKYPIEESGISIEEDFEISSKFASF